MHYHILALVVVCATLGCEAQHEPCSGMKFDPLTLPTSFSVTSDGNVLGEVTMNAEQNVSFAPDPSADPERLTRFEGDFQKYAAAGEANYTYRDRDGKGTHFSCGGTAKKGTPEYPAAFKLALYSDYYGLVDTAK